MLPPTHEANSFNVRPGSDEKHRTLSPGAIAGIATGGTVAVVLILIAFVLVRTVEFVLEISSIFSEKKFGLSFFCPCL